MNWLVTYLTARYFRLPADVKLQVRVVDPLNAYLIGEVNSWKDHDVRRALMPLSRMAEEMVLRRSSCDTSTRQLECTPSLRAAAVSTSLVQLALHCS